MRFITTVPTAISPSRLERFDSKYMARIRQSRSLELATNFSVSAFGA
jgi:hypothetical protein